MKAISMAWFDLETTGLEANKDVPLELGVILTNDWGVEIASTKFLILETDNGVFEMGMRRGREHEYVNAMHTASGLWDSLEIGPVFHRREVDGMIVEFLTDWGVEPGSLPMCGNSIGSLDRPFALVHFPKINEFLSYRNVDMSTLKELCRRLNPGLFENLKPWIDDKNAATHRVLEDCRASIKEYQCYIDEFLIVGDD